VSFVKIDAGKNKHNFINQPTIFYSMFINPGFLVTRVSIYMRTSSVSLPMFILVSYHSLLKEGGDMLHYFPTFLFL
jgi:hypothetical protein